MSLYRKGNIGIAVSSTGVQSLDLTPSASAEGWTDIAALINSAPYADSRVVYVSSSLGNDGTGQIYTPASGALGGQPLEPTGSIAPYATLAAAWAQIRDGQADVMLLRRGDTWAGASGDLQTNKSGASSTAPLIVAAYGPVATARPVVRRVYPETFADPGPTNLLFAHYTIDFLTSGLVGDQTLRARGVGGSMRFEGVFFSGNAATQATVFLLVPESDSFEMFRCGWKGVSPYALYDVIPDGAFTFEENIGYKQPDYVSTIGFDHNNYFNYQVGDIVSRKNVTAFSFGDGFRQRGLGTVEACLSLSPDLTDFDIGIQQPNPGDTFANGQVRGTYLTYRYNVGLNPGTAVALYNIKNAVLEHNIFRNQYLYHQNSANVWPVTDVVVQDNIFYNCSVLPGGGHTGTIEGPYLFRRNDFQNPAGGALMNMTSNDFTYEANNRFYSSSAQSGWFGGYTSAYADYVPSRGSNTQVTYTDPNRDIVSYMQTLGVSPANEEQAIEWFINGVPGEPSLAGAMNNRLGAWDDRFTAVAVINYVRAGFDLAAVP